MATIDVEVTITDPVTLIPATYSNVVVGNPPQGGLSFNNGDRKQVVLLQCVDAAGAIQWQRYFFGVTPLLPKESRRPTNARAVSVWAAATEEDTRIAICGETYDDRLPLSQAPAGFAQPVLTTTPDPTGFIAVYDGSGDLLWTHHFFGAALVGTSNQPDCAITDVSIRVEEGRDVVTYCGISTYGNPAGGNAWLDPILPYQTDATADNLGDGDTDFGLYQWDGIVGRISRNHDTPYDPQNPLLTLEREFHSIVGGPDQDGLFGLAEMEDDRFVVVGSTRELGFEAPLIGFPFTPAHAVLYPHRVATIVGLDAAPTRQAVPQPLQLESALALGSWGLASSHATDVLVQPRWFDEPRINAVYVVGTTNDPNFLLSVGATPTTMVAGTVLGGVPTTEWSTLEGDSDGFLVAGEDIPIADLLFMNTTQGPARGGVFVGGPGVDGLNGISAWSEHTDHVHVCGYSSYLEQYQIQVASFIHPFPFVPLRRIEFGTADSDRPTVLGFNNATDGFGAPSYQTAILGDFVAGGGIAVDARGRMTVVGATAGAIGYPVEGGGRSYRGDQDAVRTELDMLPIGVGRTDGTGSTLAGVSAPLPPAGFDGGTTPACLVAQTPFGIRVGEPLPNPYLRRMLIDLEGNNEEDWYPVIWASRPTELGEVVAAAIQIGLPTTAPVMLDSAELWTLNNPLVLNEVWLGNNQRSWGVPFTIPLPAGPAQFSAQVACLLVSGPLTSGACTGQLTTFAGPALFFEY